MPPPIQWYPGHIAKAEKALLEQLKRVDVVLEVRDARIPLSTKHPRIDTWVGTKDRVLVMNRVDMISPDARAAWESWLRQRGEIPYFTDAQQGKGVLGVAKAAQGAGTAVNERRKTRGMLPRPVRAVVLGFPNVGKSALINRLLKRKVVESARRAGVTRQLRWVRISDELELLDAPGVLPAQIHDQTAAMKLAICDDIGEAAYDNQRVAAALVDLLMAQQPTMGATGLGDRYRLSPVGLSGESYVETLAEERCQGNINRAASQILNDFRRGDLGAIALELPPSEAGL
jgi:ribosome biogenesis GTPase A